MTCTLIRLDNGLPFVSRAELVTNDDGSVSFKLDGGWAGQEPNIYGQRHDQPTISDPPQAYQRATQAGNLVTFLTRPQDNPLVYLMGVGRAF